MILRSIYLMKGAESNWFGGVKKVSREAVPLLFAWMRRAYYKLTIMSQFGRHFFFIRNRKVFGNLNILPLIVVKRSGKFITRQIHASDSCSYITFYPFYVGV